MNKLKKKKEFFVFFCQKQYNNNNQYMATSRTLFSNVITLPLNTINNVKST